MKIGILPSIKENYKNQFEYSIDIRFQKLFEKCFKKKNEIILIDDQSKLNNIDLIVFSGGNDLVKYSKLRENKIRHNKFLKILKKAIKLKKNIFSICFGSLFLANYFGSKIVKTSNHKKKHKIFINKRNKKRQYLVNSYHNFKIIDLDKKFQIIANAFDGSIESFYLAEKKIFCVMWHPERYQKIQKLDIELMTRYIYLDKTK